MPRRTPPPRKLPQLYLAFGHLSLLLAAAVPALSPRSIAGFFYHGPMFYAVHLVTLGWILLSVLGYFYVVAPFALRTDFPGGRLHGWICGAVVVGVSGVVAHFKLGSYLGVAWSGLLLLLALPVLWLRILSALRTSEGPLSSRAMVGAAFTNLLLAVLYGTLLAFNRHRSFLPGTQIVSVFGHVHLAAAGFAALLVAGIGYRLFPMFFPAAPLKGLSPWVVLVLVETGVLGLAVSFLLNFEKRAFFGIPLALGLLVFVRDVARMRRDPRPPPVKLKRPDVAMLHALQALVYLLISVALGLLLAFSPGWRVEWIMVYGVFGLLGFLGQIILGMAMRLLPMFLWTPESGSPHDLPSRPLQWATLLGWSAGVPLLAWGLGADRVPLVSLGGWALLVAAAAAAGNALVTSARSRGSPASPR